MAISKVSFGMAYRINCSSDKMKKQVKDAANDYFSYRGDSFKVIDGFNEGDVVLIPKEDLKSADDIARVLTWASDEAKAGLLRKHDDFMRVFNEHKNNAIARISDCAIDMYV